MVKDVVAALVDREVVCVDPAVIAAVVDVVVVDSVVASSAIAAVDDVVVADSVVASCVLGCATSVQSSCFSGFWQAPRPHPSGAEGQGKLSPP